jgi:hypothetical protein
MGGGAQADFMGPEFDLAVKAVTGLVMQGNANSHDDNRSKVVAMRKT